MKIKKLFILIVVLSGLNSRAQNLDLDSLVVVARNTKDDSVSILKMNIAGYYYLFRNQDKGLALLKEARKKAVNKKQEYCFIECVNLQGVYHALTENPDSAQFYYEKAKKLSRKANYPNLEVRSTNNLGMLQWNRGNFSQALGLFFEALRQNEKVPASPLKTLNSSMHNNIGLIYQEMGMYDKALEYHKLAYAERLSRDKRMELAASLNNLGICYDRLGMRDKAVATYKEGMTFAKQYNPAEYYKLLENYSGLLIAEEHYNEALTLLLEIVNRPHDIMMSNKSTLGVYSELTNAYINLLQPAEAITYGKLGLAVLDKQPDLIVYAGDLYIGLSRAYYMSGNLDSGHTYSKKFSEVTKDRFKTENAKGIADLEVKYETEKKEKLIVEGRLKLLKAEAEGRMQEVMIAENRAKLLKSEAEADKKEILIAEGNLRLLKSEAETDKKEKLIAQNKARLVKTEAEARQKNYMLMIALCFIGFISVIGYLLYRQQKLRTRQLEKEFELKTALSQIESQNRLQEQRLSISRDLHDNIGAQLTFIISSLDNLKFRLTENTPAVGTKLEGISNFTQQTIIELRDTIWAMNTKHITFEDLRVRILNFMEKAQEYNENIDFKFSIDPSLMEVELSSVAGMNIYRTIQEAVNNAIKHANATSMEIMVLDSQDIVTIRMRDNGKGFNPETELPGNGLLNMEKRIETIGGEFSISTGRDKGTTITLHLSKKMQSA